jgi:hypothetical protein
MKALSKTSLILVGLVACMLTGCGSVDSPGHKGDPLFSIPCSIQDVPANIDAERLRAAFLWTEQMADENRKFKVVEDALPLSPQIFGGFDLDLYSLPGESSLFPPEDGLLLLLGNPIFDPAPIDPTQLRLKWGLARLIIYEDSNRNGRLDQLAPEATTYIDNAVGPTELYMVLYIEGDPASIEALKAAGLDAKLGFTFRKFDHSDRNSENWTSVPVDLNQPLAISLAKDDPWVTGLVCETPHDGYSQHDAGCPILSYREAPSEAVVYCYNDNRGARFDWEGPMTKACPCCRLDGPLYYCPFELAEGEPAPADWPCPPK